MAKQISPAGDAMLSLCQEIFNAGFKLRGRVQAVGGRQEDRRQAERVIAEISARAAERF